MELEKVLSQFNKEKKLYVEESNIVFGTIVNKYKNSKQAIGVRTTLGYMLPDNTIYDFITKNVFQLYNQYLLEQEGEVFLLSHRVFKDSKRKINIKSYNTKIKPLIDYHIKRHNNEIDKLEQKYYMNEEHIPMKIYK